VVNGQCRKTTSRPQTLPARDRATHGSRHPHPHGATHASHYTRSTRLIPDTHHRRSHQSPHRSRHPPSVFAPHHPHRSLEPGTGASDADIPAALALHRLRDCHNTCSRLIYRPTAARAPLSGSDEREQYVLIRVPPTPPSKASPSAAARFPPPSPLPPSCPTHPRTSTLSHGLQRGFRRQDVCGGQHDQV